MYDGAVGAVRLELRLTSQSEWIKIFDPRDWTVTVPSDDPNDKRAGRWAGQGKTECGLHGNAPFSN